MGLLLEDNVVITAKMSPCHGFVIVQPRYRPQGVCVAGCVVHHTSGLEGRGGVADTKFKMVRFLPAEEAQSPLGAI